MHHLSDARAIHTAKSLMQNKPFHFSRHLCAITINLFELSYFLVPIMIWAYLLGIPSALLLLASLATSNSSCQVQKATLFD